MIDRKHNVLVLVNDAEVGFRFSTWALKQTQQKAGCKGLVELFTKMGSDDGNIDAESLSILIMESYNDYIYEEKLKTGDINQRDACRLIDAMGGPISCLMKISDGLKGHLPKNPEPPQMVGEAISQ